MNSYRKLVHGRCEKDMKCTTEDLPFKLRRGSLNCVQINNFIYLFGTDVNSNTPFAERYDGTARTWLNLASIPRQGTVGSAAVSVSDSIVLVGGMLSAEPGLPECSKFINLTLCYKIKDNEWNPVKSFPVPVATTDLWLSKSSMNEARSDALFEAYDGNLFLLGGRANVPSSPVSSREVYNIQENQWTAIAELAPAAAYVSASFIDGSDIFIVGGLNLETRQASDKISVFNTESRKVVTQKARLIKPTYYLVGTILKVAYST